MKLARIVYWIAAVYGFAMILPMFFTEQSVSAQNPPAITHAEYYYGFASITLTWQILFVMIALRPERYHAIIGLSVVEKLALVPGFLILFPQGRYPQMWIPALLIDLVFCGLFVAVFIMIRQKRQPAT
jgi:hypothetical protein